LHNKPNITTTLIQVVFNVIAFFNTEKFTTENDAGMWHYILQPLLSSWTSDLRRNLLSVWQTRSKTYFDVVLLLYGSWISRLKADMQFSLALALMPDKPITYLQILQY